MVHPAVEVLMSFYFLLLIINLILILGETNSMFLGGLKDSLNPETHQISDRIFPMELMFSLKRMCECEDLQEPFRTRYLEIINNSESDAADKFDRFALGE
jgi:hypothetical protein